MAVRPATLGDAQSIATPDRDRSLSAMGCRRINVIELRLIASGYRPFAHRCCPARARAASLAGQELRTPDPRPPSLHITGL
jgi:hypothetical protein